MNTLKIRLYSFALLSASLVLASCNRNEGLGGTSSLEGYVYNVIHYDDNFSFRKDTFPALGKKVYITFGNEAQVGDDTDAGQDGYYRFNYLREGNYTVYALSEAASAEKTAVSQKAKVSGNLTKAQPIYIHSGKAYGTAMIRGKVEASYYHNGSYRDEGPGVGMRAYIRHVGDDVRVGGGTFMFQKLLPGEYEVAVETEDKNTEKVSLVIQSIRITETEKIYELPEVYYVINCV